MTAVVGVLNKQSIALAADSAVTFSGPGRHKILNRANKLFALSKFHPVGIVLYNSAEFMGTPWETLIKMYRKSLKDQSYKNINEYIDDFFRFLRDNDWFTDEHGLQFYKAGFIRDALNLLLRKVQHLNPEVFRPPQDKSAIVNALINIIGHVIQVYSSPETDCSEFKDYKFEEFSMDFKEAIEKVLFAHGDLFLSLTSDQLKHFQSCFWKLLCSEQLETSFTGLVFAGFGDEQIFPEVVTYGVCFALGNRFKHFRIENKCVQISVRNPGGVVGFAQTDVIDTILSGSDPRLNQVYAQNFLKLIEKLKDTLTTELHGLDPSLITAIQGLDPAQLTKAYVEMNKEYQLKAFIRPTYEAVSLLSKEDLAEMAESLIYLTYLKRRITFAEESVGGPVDVALLSKGDGFVWIKRKHYFSPELNPHFFSNYFKI